MGGAIVLKLAARYQDEMRGIVGLESSAYAPGRYNDFLHHPAIHGGELCASYTYGLNSPYSPEVNRRENWWYYSQSGPGVYQGDVYFYSIDWDVRVFCYEVWGLTIPNVIVVIVPERSKIIFLYLDTTSSFHLVDFISCVRLLT